jgi:pimeloyl-ACP methyl ester carboxylesterase
MDKRTRRIRTPANIELAVDTAGPDDAPSIVFLHGGGQTRHSWHGAMNSLVRMGYRAMSYDARGHGDSGWAEDGDYSVSALANDLDAVLADIPAPVGLVGASMGGMTAFYAIGRSARPMAQALVMVDIALRPAPEGAKKILTFMNANSDGFANLDEAVDAVSRYNPDRPRPANPGGLMKNLRERSGRLFWHWDPRLISSMQTPEPPAFADELLAVADGVTLPTLLIHGGKSDIVDDESIAEIRNLVPQTELYEVPGAGHMIAGDRNDAFNEGLIAFIQKYIPIAAR